MTTADRLQRAAAVLETLEYCRVKSKNRNLGASLEEKIIARELEQLEISTEMADVDARLEKNNGVHPGTTRSA